MKVQLLMTAIVGVAVISAMTSSQEAYAMEVPFWYETDLLTGESYYVDHFNEGKKTWVKATPEPTPIPLQLQGIGNVIQTHSVIDSNDVSNAEELTSQEIKNIKIKNEANRTYDLLATLYPGLYPERVSEVIVVPEVVAPIPVVSEVIVVPEVVVPIPVVPEVIVVPEVVVPIPEPIVVPEVVVPIPEPIVVPEVVVPIPEPIVVPEVVVPIPEPISTPNVTVTPPAPIDERQNMDSDDWDEFLKDVIPADRPLESIEDFFD
jgi:hypothetical protein